MVFAKVADIEKVELKSRADVLLKVLTPPRVKASRSGDIYVVFSVGDTYAVDLYDPSNGILSVFVWLGCRKSTAFDQVKEGMYFYARNAIVDRKHGLADDGVLQVKCFEDNLITFYDDLPKWAPPAE